MSTREGEVEGERVVVVVEEAEAAKSALLWARANLLRPRDVVTLLYVFPSSRSKKKQRARRLKGFQLALSFRELCIGDLSEVKVEIVVTEGDQVAVISGLVDEIRASALVIGLHERSCLYRMTAQYLGSNNLNCRVLAVKPQGPTTTVCHGFATVEFTRVEISKLCIQPRKIPYQIFPFCPLRRSRRRMGRRGSELMKEMMG